MQIFCHFSDKVCKRPWNFERVPNSIIQGHDRALIFTSTKEACLAACLNEVITHISHFLAADKCYSKYCERASVVKLA